MKALIISALVFFSLRAMSAEVGESLAADCTYINQSSSRDAKVVTTTQAPAEQPKPSSISK